MSQKGKLTKTQCTKVRFIARTTKKVGKGTSNGAEKGQKKTAGDTVPSVLEGPSIDVAEVKKDTTSPSKIGDLKKAFALFDQNSDGCINKEEVMEVLRGAGVAFTPEQLDVFMARLDKDGDGEVDYDEFCNMMKDVVISSPKQQHISEAFKAIDINGDGTITKKELQNTIIQFGGSLSDSEANDVMALADRNGDGEIDYEEFVTLMYLLDLQPPIEG